MKTNRFLAANLALTPVILTKVQWDILVFIANNPGTLYEAVEEATGYNSANIVVTASRLEAVGLLQPRGRSVVGGRQKASLTITEGISFVGQVHRL